MEHNTEKSKVLEWYDFARAKIHLILRYIAIVVVVVLGIGVVVDVEAGFIIGKIGMPEFKEFYKTFNTDLIHMANVADACVAAIIVLLFRCAQGDVNDKTVCGVWFYNIALGAQVLFLGKHMAVDMFLFGRFPFLGILYVALIIFSIFIFILNILHYRKYKGSYVDGVGGTLAIIIFWVIFASVVSLLPIKEIRNKVRERKDNYAAKEYMAMYNILHVGGDTPIENNIDAYIALKYVSLFNERGRVYTPEEMDEAISIYKSRYYDGNSNYGGDSWYPIVEFNDDLELIEEKYDFSQYSYRDEVEPNYVVFRRLVCRRLDCLGQDYPLITGDFCFDEVDAACEYVYDMLTSGKPVEELGTMGEEILLTFPQEIQAGTKGYYDIGADYEKTYATITSWSKVTCEGSEEAIETYYPYRNSEFTFEEGCVYMANINIYPEITYFFNEGMEVIVDGIDCEDYYYETAYFAAGPYISVRVFITVGDQVATE